MPPIGVSDAIIMAVNVRTYFMGCIAGAGGLYIMLINEFIKEYCSISCDTLQTISHGKMVLFHWLTDNIIILRTTLHCPKHILGLSEFFITVATHWSYEYYWSSKYKKKYLSVSRRWGQILTYWQSFRKFRKLLKFLFPFRHSYLLPSRCFFSVHRLYWPLTVRECPS